MLNFDQEFSISQLITLSFKKEKLIIEFHQFQGYDRQTPLYRFFFCQAPQFQQPNYYFL